MRIIICESLRPILGIAASASAEGEDDHRDVTCGRCGKVERFTRDSLAGKRR
jgi:hypothetical protein